MVTDRQFARVIYPSLLVFDNNRCSTYTQTLCHAVEELLYLGTCQNCVGPTCLTFETLIDNVEHTHDHPAVVFVRNAMRRESLIIALQPRDPPCEDVMFCSVWSTVWFA